MFRIVTAKEKLRKAEEENQALKGKVSLQAAQIDYLAMMGDIEMPEDNTEGGAEMEAAENE